MPQLFHKILPNYLCARKLHQFMGTGGKYFPSASTKDTLSVDKVPSDAPFIHKRFPFRGQSTLRCTVHPQKIPSLWTKATPGHGASTNHPLCVDRLLQIPLRITAISEVKNPASCSAGTIRPPQPHPTAIPS